MIKSCITLCYEVIVCNSEKQCQCFPIAFNAKGSDKISSSATQASFLLSLILMLNSSAAQVKCYSEKFVSNCHGASWVSLHHEHDYFRPFSHDVLKQKNTPATKKHMSAETVSWDFMAFSPWDSIYGPCQLALLWPLTHKCWRILTLDKLPKASRLWVSLRVLESGREKEIDKTGGKGGREGG